jgi:hypothetical protein
MLESYWYFIFLMLYFEPALFVVLISDSSLKVLLYAYVSLDDCRLSFQHLISELRMLLGHIPWSIKGKVICLVSCLLFYNWTYRTMMVFEGS